MTVLMSFTDQNAHFSLWCKTCSDQNREKLDQPSCLQSTIQQQEGLTKARRKGEVVQSTVQQRMVLNGQTQ